MLAVFSQLSADAGTPTAVNAALAQVLNEQLSLCPGCDVFADLLTSDVQQLYETRLRQASNAQPAMKTAKQQAPDAGTAEVTDLSIKVCSMDGSSVHVEVARDATISDVKVCIVKISKPPPGTVTRLHAAGIEEPLTNAKRVGSLFVGDNGGKPPALFMFQTKPTLKELDAEMAALRKSHAESVTDQEAARAKEAAAHARDVAARAKVQKKKSSARPR